MTSASPQHGPGPRDSKFTSRAQLAFRRGSTRRLAGAVAVALIALVVLVLLGPSRDAVRKRFEYYGAPGEMVIMQEISIDEGSAKVHQLPQTLQTPPPPSRIEIEPEPENEDATDPKPRDAPVNDLQEIDLPSTDPNPDADRVMDNQVELALPQQTNPDWYLLVHVLPEYPFDAPPSEQRIPVIQVRVAIFVNREGDVTEAMIQSATGGSTFTNEVLKKVQQWKFGWRIDPEAGRWIELTFNFNSPYAPRPRR